MPPAIAGPDAVPRATSAIPQSRVPFMSCLQFPTLYPGWLRAFRCPQSSSLPSRSLARVVVPLPQRLHQAMLFGRQLLRFELEGQLVELASEAERHVVAVLEKCDRGAGVHADVESLVPREGERDRVFHELLVDL